MSQEKWPKVRCCEFGFIKSWLVGLGSQFELSPWFSVNKWIRYYSRGIWVPVAMVHHSDCFGMGVVQGYEAWDPQEEISISGG